MKYYLYILFSVIMFSCKPQNNIIEKNNGIPSSQKRDNLTEVESEIINTFLDFELKKELYKDYQYIIIEEALKKTKPLSAYELNYNYKKSWGRDIKFWILDSVQIKKDIENEEVYHWKITDFKNTKVDTLKNEELRKMINSGMLFHDANRIVIYLSKPLIIDNDNAFLSFEIDNCRYLCNNITHFTVLMRKVDDKWEVNSYYEDGVYN